MNGIRYGVSHRSVGESACIRITARTVALILEKHNMSLRIIRGFFYLGSIRSAVARRYLGEGAVAREAYDVEGDIRRDITVAGRNDIKLDNTAVSRLDLTVRDVTAELQLISIAVICTAHAIAVDIASRSTFREIASHRTKLGRVSNAVALSSYFERYPLNANTHTTSRNGLIHGKPRDSGKEPDDEGEDGEGAEPNEVFTGGNYFLLIVVVVLLLTLCSLRS